MRILLIVIIVFLQARAYSQIIKGKVLDSQSGTPLTDVTVYISNSSRSTTTDTKGFFSIEGFSNSNYDIVFSLVGYQITSLHSDKISANQIEIRLQARKNDLSPVVIQNFDKDGWMKWGKLFTDLFIGTLPFSDQCIIKNKDAVKFRYSKKTNSIEVVALEPLEIENKYLGYKIRYDLQQFIYDFNSTQILYTGYPMFKNISTRKKYLLEREKRREDVYEGSLLHFMRALYSNALEKEGFKMQRLKKIPNKEKKRADSIFNANRYISFRPDGTKVIMNKMEQVFPPDSVNYYKSLRLQPDILWLLDKHFLTSDSIYVRNDTIGKIYSFPLYLYITYPNKLQLPEYYKNRATQNNNSYITSIASLSPDTELLVFENGQYAPPTDFIIEAYWSWSEKVSSMLPFDYKSYETINQ